MIRHMISLCIAKLIIFSLMGCATITRGTTQDIPISSVPAGAQVSINNQFWGVTPIIAKLDRKHRHNVLIELEGYKPVVTIIVSQQDMAIAGNCLAGGLPGVAVDSMSGAASVLKPEMVHAVLVARGEDPPSVSTQKPVSRPPPQPQPPVVAPTVRRQQQKSDQSETIAVVLLAAVLAMGLIIVSSGS